LNNEFDQYGDWGGRSSADVTQLLVDMKTGDPAAADKLLPIVYAELRSIAERMFTSERANHTLQPTALVHDAFLRLVGQSDPKWESREHFIAVATRAMRNLLINHARDRKALKRGGVARPVTLSRADCLNDDQPLAVDILVLDDALMRLAAADSRQAQVVELRIFGGLTIEECAKAMNLNEKTVKKDWRVARAWLRLYLTDNEATPPPDRQA
jgi:RNA polymerase sigma factor (TIGR02999 family)